MTHNLPYVTSDCSFMAVSSSTSMWQQGKLAQPNTTAANGELFQANRPGVYPSDCGESFERSPGH